MTAIRNWAVGRILSFRYAFAGIAVVLGQRNMQIHLFIGIVVVICGMLWQLSVGEWLAIVLTITLIVVLEAINTAVEAVVDLASPQQHPLAKRAKDVAAGAVLLGAIGAAVEALIIFGPRLLRLAEWMIS